MSLEKIIVMVMSLETSKRERDSARVSITSILIVSNNKYVHVPPAKAEKREESSLDRLPYFE